jgi:N6-adenosine-specific RNA methylase IME4
LITSWPFPSLMPMRYGVILADPPWRYETYSEAGRGRSPDGAPAINPDGRQGAPVRHYLTMTLPELQALPVLHLAAQNCVLLMWAIDSMLPEAIELGRRWGFAFKTVGFYWAKERRDPRPRNRHPPPAHRQFPLGMGHWTRGNPEQCLLFTLGTPERLSAGVRKLIVAPRREHSRKPDEQYAAIEALCPGPYAELFARTTRPGWDAWGNQTDRFQQEAA